MNGNDLKSLRLAFRWTQMHLAQELNVSRNTVGRWESGVSPIPLAVQKLLMEWQRRQMY